MFELVIDFLLDNGKVDYTIEHPGICQSDPRWRELSVELAPQPGLLKRNGCISAVFDDRTYREHPSGKLKTWKAERRCYYYAMMFLSLQLDGFHNGAEGPTYKTIKIRCVSALVS